MSVPVDANQAFTEIEHPVLADYLSRLRDNPQADTRIWRNREGQAIGHYFNAALSSVFRAMHHIDGGAVLAYEGLTRNYPGGEYGDAVWQTLDRAASDNESIELDRLCRMVHSINFFRQPHSRDTQLFLSVHARLMTAVDGNHGAAFNRILHSLELSEHQITLQLPSVLPAQYWLLNFVAENYRRNGFRVAVSAPTVPQAFAMLDKVQADAIRIDARQSADDEGLSYLLELCTQRGMRTIFHNVDTPTTRASLTRLAGANPAVLGQGLAWEAPGYDLIGATLAGNGPRQTPT